MRNSNSNSISVLELVGISEHTRVVTVFLVLIPVPLSVVFSTVSFQE
jgi:hypothetical protein